MGRSILLINGPNLNLLGTREPHIYGRTTLKDLVLKQKGLGPRSLLGLIFQHLEANCKEHAQSLGAELQFFQSNTEGAIIDRIHEARGKVDVIVINPAGYRHTSVAILDALAGVDIPFIELHISNTHTREKFRHRSYFSDKAAAVIMGLGVHGYKYAIDHAVRNL